MKLIFLGVFIILFSSCSDKSTNPVPVIPRDTTITVVNAVTQLHLDSLDIQRFTAELPENESVAKRIFNFYNARNYQFAWFNEEGLTEQAKAFWNLNQRRIDIFNDSTLYDPWLQDQMMNLLNQDSIDIDARLRIPIELKLTAHFYSYLDVVYQGKISAREMNWFIPKRKLDEQAMIDSFFYGNEPKLKPLNRSFYLLQDKLVNYVSIAKKGGWPEVSWKKKLKNGDQDSAVILLKKRLLISGDLQNKDDTTALFNDPLEAGIKKVQRSFGLEPTGVFDKELSEALNITVSQRIKTMIINLERLKWMPEENKNRIVANIPEFRLHVYENDRERLSMKIVVGKAANQTVIFSDELKYIVFNPYWNVPRSIVREEILPELSKNRNYLEKNNMEITGYSNGLPVIRQKPGKGNALGNIKFIFPNRYHIYFHDTPARSLFSRQSRAFSHGCIRLDKPVDLAEYLLSKQVADESTFVVDMLELKKEKWITLKSPVPVFILYFTAWVDKDGLLNFRDDIYGHDKNMESHLWKSTNEDL